MPFSSNLVALVRLVPVHIFPINGISLKFFGGYILVEVENNLGDTIRINSKPVTKSKVIESESSVGFHGKLFFINSNEKQLEFPVKGVPASELV